MFEIFFVERNDLAYLSFFVVSYSIYIIGHEAGKLHSIPIGFIGSIWIQEISNKKSFRRTYYNLII